MAGGGSGLRVASVGIYSWDFGGWQPPLRFKQLPV